MNAGIAWISDERPSFYARGSFARGTTRIQPTVRLGGDFCRADASLVDQGVLALPDGEGDWIGVADRDTALAVAGPGGEH